MIKYYFFVGYLKRGNFLHARAVPVPVSFLGHIVSTIRTPGDSKDTRRCLNFQDRRVSFDPGVLLVETNSIS